MHVHGPQSVLDCCYAADLAGEHSLGEGVEEGEEEEGFGVGGGVGAFLWGGGGGVEGAMMLFRGVSILEVFSWRFSFDG